MAAWQPRLALDSPGACMATRELYRSQAKTRAHRLRAAPPTTMVVGPFRAPDATLQTAGAP